MPWSPFTTRRGGRAWRNDATGEVRYQAESPGERKPGQSAETDSGGGKKAAGSVEDFQQAFQDMAGTISDESLDKVHGALQSGKPMTKLGIAERVAEHVFRRGYQDKESVRNAMLLGQATKDTGIKGPELSKRLNEAIDKVFPKKTSTAGSPDSRTVAQTDKTVSTTAPRKVGLPSAPQSSRPEHVKAFRDRWQTAFASKAAARGHNDTTTAFRMASQIAASGKTGKALLTAMNAALKQHFPIVPKTAPAKSWLTHFADIATKVPTDAKVKDWHQGASKKAAHWFRTAKNYPAHVVDSAVKEIDSAYDTLRTRYGHNTASAILAAGLVAAPVALPFKAAGALLAGASHVYRRIRGAKQMSTAEHLPAGKPAKSMAELRKLAAAFWKELTEKWHQKTNHPRQPDSQITPI